MRLLTLKIHEPLPGRVLPLMAQETGPEESARRYRAIVVTTLRQLRGLQETRLRIVANPEDADEALRFWLLPRLADRWEMEGSVFRSDGWEIEFGGQPHGDYAVVARGEVLCPFMGARWVHAGMLGLECGEHSVVGPAAGGGEYFRAQSPLALELAERPLPELPVICDPIQWQAAMESPLGPALKKAWEEEA